MVGQVKVDERAANTLRLLDALYQREVLSWRLSFFHLARGLGLPPEVARDAATTWRRLGWATGRDVRLTDKGMHACAELGCGRDL